MSYEKTTWAPGDVITSEKLNHLEGGVAAAGSLPTITESDDHKLLGIADNNYKLIDAKYGWREPDQFVYTTTAVSGEDRISPAIIQLTTGERLAFVIVDEFHPDGIMLTAYTYSDDHYVHWNGECPGTGEIESFGYLITYKADNDTNYISARHPNPTDPGSTVYFNATFYAAGTIHKIPKDYVESDLPQPGVDDLDAFVFVTNRGDGPVYGLVPNPANTNLLSWNGGSPTVLGYDANLQRWQLKINSKEYIEQANNSIVSSSGFPPRTDDHHYFTRYLIENDAITTVEVYEVVTRTVLGGTLSVVSGTLYTKTLS